MVRRDIELGDGVWVQDRRDPDNSGTLSCYGSVVNIDYGEEEVLVLFGPSDYEEYPIELFEDYNTRLGQWLIYKD